MTHLLRRACAADVLALASLRVEMFGAMGTPGFEGSRLQENSVSWLSAHADDTAVASWVIEVDGDVVACGIGEIRAGVPSPAVPDGRDVYISNLCTHPEHRGQGYARDLPSSPRLGSPASREASRAPRDV